MRAGPSLRSCRTRQIRPATAAVVRCGVLWDRLDRPCRPTAPSARRRRSHLWAVARELPISAATCATGQPEGSRSTNSRLP